MENDEIVDIKESQIRYFGGPGKMLLPTPATVAAQIRQIPAGRLLTTDLLRKRLADQFGVQGTCPVTTVTCPSSGQITVMVGAYSSTTAGTCTPAIR